MRPARIFDVSMGDMFHEALTVEDVADVWEWMGRSRLGRSGTRRGPTRIVVTKRPERAAELLPQLAELLDARGVPWPVVHLLTTVERQDYAAPRLDALVRCARHVRLLGVSAEPLLGPLDLRPWLDHLGWVIVGAESGTGARPMRVGWAADLLYQCQAAGMPMFVKQLGSRPIIGEGEATWAVARREWPGPHHGAEPPVVHDRSTGLVTAWLSRKGGDPSQWPERLRVREWPAP
jgi:protein gp37